MKVTIIGAGYVGGQIADRLSYQGLAEDIVIIDIDKNIALAKSEDISHAICINKLNCRIIGSDNFETMSGSDIVVITAGNARKPGMSRDDLAMNNHKVIRDVSEKIVKFASNSIIIVVTNPVDIMTYFVLKYTGFSRFKVLGMSGVLDSGRLSYAIIKRCPEFSPNEIKSIVVGPHGNSMICLPEYTTVGRKNLRKIFSERELIEMFKEVSTTGAKLVSLYKGNSAFFGPSAAVAKIVRLIFENSPHMVTCSTLLSGEFGLDNVCLGVPVVLSSRGIKEIIELDLTEQEEKKLLNIAKDYKQKISQLEGA